MNRRFVITALVASSLLTVRIAPALEEQPPAAQEPAAAPAATAPAAAEAPAEPAPAKFGPDQLDQLVGPIALYADPLLIQVLIASTYPLEIVEADRWRSKNKELKDDALTKALETQDWDPSVEGLTQFPDLLKRMSENLDWTKDLGDAFLSQKDDVLNAVQRMRKLAATSGALQTTKEQTVTKEVVNNKETIVIEPAQPETVYVPQYPPTAYGPPPAQPYYPTSYGYPPGYAYPGYTAGDMAMTGLLSFGVGMGVGALISDGCDWDDHDVYVNNNYGGGGGGKNNSNNNININREKNVDRSKTEIGGGNRGDRGRGDGSRGQKWQHNPEHRRNVGYRDPGTAKRFEGQSTTAARQRQAKEAARGFDGGGAATRPATRPASASQRPAGSGQRGGGQADRRGDGQRAGADRGGRAPDRGGGAARPSTRPASGHGGGRDSGFGGYGNAGDTRQASQRGAQSRGGQSWAGSGGGGRGGGGRGGGGGGGARGGGGRR